jgi:hypothetical protein
LSRYGSSRKWNACCTGAAAKGFSPRRSNRSSARPMPVLVLKSD